MNEIKLVALFCYICECYDTNLRWNCQRFSNNSTALKFTDEELLTIYIYSVIEEEKYKVKSIYDYAAKYLRSWFPSLPSYQAFNRRLNCLNNVFPLLINSFIYSHPTPKNSHSTYLYFSFKNYFRIIIL